MDIVTVLPLAFVMIAGPQIISAVFFATSESWRRASSAYVLGALMSITAVVTAAYLLAQGVGGEEESGLSGIDYAILALLFFAMVHNYRQRNQSEPPKWMGRLQSATPRFAFVLGFLLLGLFPSDLITSLTVGGHLANDGDPWTYAIPFILLTVLLLALPALCVAALGERAQRVLPKVRDWMNTNSWIISEAVIAFFIVIILSG
ncbi:MAG TPA: GAP family protein [Solirubrobacterales bacterium]